MWYNEVLVMCGNGEEEYIGGLLDPTGPSPRIPVDSSEGDRVMKTRKDILWLVLLGLLAVGLIAGPELWAAPGQNPARQTVPTKTPEQPPTSEPTSSPSKPKPKKPDPTASSEVNPTVSPVPSEAATTEGAIAPLLPDAGGTSIRLYPGVAMIVVGFFILVIVGKQGDVR